jgi:hypothetical protein
MENKDLANSLLEVRKAYRLLHDYQKRILDLMLFIGNRFNRSYEGGTAMFSDVSPRNGKGTLQLWSWDWLNMYMYEFHFRTVKIKEDEYIFSILLISDDGFFKTKFHNDDNKVLTSKNDTFKFKKEYESNSKIVFVLGKNCWDESNFSWNSKDITLGDYGYENLNDNKEILYKSYNLALFSNEETTEIQLKDFELFCLDKNFDFKLVDKRNF